MHLGMADQSGKNIVLREYRKANWTVDETMVLIEAKKMDDERRMKKSGDSQGRSKPTELRWKWVEDYCWKRGCSRSQNQCNDKWDNLIRDYKKVRKYQRRIAESGEGNTSNEGSYWEMEKNERKEKNLPSNMLRQIYDRLEEVVEKKGDQKVVAAGGSRSISNIPYVTDRTMTSVQASLPPLLQHQLSAPIPAAIPLPLPAMPLLPPPPAAPAPLVQPPPLSYAQPLPTVDSDTSEYSDSPAKRRRRGGNGEGTSGTASANNSNEVGTAISESASIIAEAIQASEERQERRHRDLFSLHERRLKIEESKTEINKRGMDGLVDAINQLANSILALASHKNQSAPK
ncbi:histone-lysine N-methyltransferase 2B-like [Durio zibethinus]|uniref:Histone-lysine N-methyltransferase 2B-like n=1 Tax=Durio zibethinus TaxID=66656 RepID=A0A6P5X8T9_DURZI|nr:histone-lysine N-methyltransferase 2B-like [Durio zibethinus]